MMIRTVCSFAANVIVTALFATTFFAVAEGSQKVICLYKLKHLSPVHLTIDELDPAIAQCDMLIYGFAGINNATNELTLFKSPFELDEGRALHRQILTLKEKYPNLKVLLGVGGNADPDREIYLKLLENPKAQDVFKHSAYKYINAYNFDGLDLAWQFRTSVPKGLNNTKDNLVYNFFFDEPVDKKADMHKEGFTKLVKSIRGTIGSKQILSVTVLPSIKIELFYDIQSIIPEIDFVTIAAYNFTNLGLDYPRNYSDWRHFKSQVELWTSNGTPSNKIIVAIQSSTRIYNMSQWFKEGAKARIWPLVLPNPQFCNHTKDYVLKDVPWYDFVNGKHAIFHLTTKTWNRLYWYEWEDSETAEHKAAYVVNNNLGGIGIHDLNSEDFQGSRCSGKKYPLLTAAKERFSRNLRKIILLE